MSNEVKTKEKIDMDPKYIVKLTVTLLGTCLIVALLLGLVNGVTAGPIAEINQQKTEAAMLAVVSDPDNTTFSDKTVSLASWIVTPSYAEANADKILRFTKALFKAMDYAADDNYEEVAGYVAAQTKTDEASVYDQRGDADWLTGEEVARGAADGTVEKYYEIQQQNFIAAGAVESEVPVSDYVMLDNMIEAGK